MFSGILNIPNPNFVQRTYRLVWSISNVFPFKDPNKLENDTITVISQYQICNPFYLFEFWLELAWLGVNCKGKMLLVIEIFFALRSDCTVTA